MGFLFAIEREAPWGRVDDSTCVCARGGWGSGGGVKAKDVTSTVGFLGKVPPFAEN